MLRVLPAYGSVQQYYLPEYMKCWDLLNLRFDNGDSFSVPWYTLLQVEIIDKNIDTLNSAIDWLDRLWDEIQISSR